MLGHAFISYSHLDVDYMQRLVAELSSRGLNIWTDRGIDPGAQWTEVIDRKIGACAAFVPIVSENSNIASWVRREILRAQQFHKEILPLQLSGDRCLLLIDLQDEDVSGGRLPSPAWIARLENLLTSTPSFPAGNEITGLLDTFTGHTRRVRSVAWSPDGRLLASGGEDTAALVRDAATGGLRRRIDHVDWVCAVGWSPDGRLLATAGGERRVVVWKGGALQATLTGHSANILSLAWSRDGRLIASASADGKVLIHSASGAGHPHEFAAHSAPVFSVCWSKAGRFATGSADRTVRRWDANRSEETGRPYPHGGAVRSVAWSPDGRMLATASRDPVIRVWDTVTDTVVATTDHTGPVTSVAWSPDGRLLACAGEDATVRLWEVGSGAEVATLTGHIGAVRSVVWSASGAGLLASGGDDGTVRTWRIP